MEGCSRQLSGYRSSSVKDGRLPHSLDREAHKCARGVFFNSDSIFRGHRERCRSQAKPEAALLRTAVVAVLRHP